jgi:hypothetical protein
MDLGFLETRAIHDEGAEMQVMDQLGNPTDMFITFAGVDSERWPPIKRGIEKAAVLGRDWDNAAAMADMALSWRGATECGEPVEFSRDRVYKLLSNAPYICEQADKFIGKRANFLKA